MARSPDFSESQSCEFNLRPIEARCLLGRRNLIDFTNFTHTHYSIQWFHLEIAARLQAIERGDLDRLIILMPPRYGKSELCSIRFPAWYLGRHPDRRIIATSYSADLASDFGRKTRDLISDPLYKSFFPNTSVSAASSSALRWDLHGNEGGYIGAGIGGPITGRGADLLLIDDPVKNAEEADSKIYRDKVWNWYQSTAYTRLENDGAIVVVLTHWHEDDLAGRLVKEAENEGDTFEVLRLPAVSAKGDPHRPVAGEKLVNGVPLWPEKHDIDKLIRIKNAISTFYWSALFQQQPQPAEGTIWLRKWFKEVAELPDYYHRIHSWDTGQKDDLSNDPSACGTFNECEDGIYLSNLFQERMEFPELKRKVIQHAEAENPDEILIEDKSSGISLIQELLNETSLPVVPFPSDDNDDMKRFAKMPKPLRARHVSSHLEAGRLKYVRGIPFINEYLDQCSQFPKTDHDEFVDITSQAIAKLKNVQIRVY